MTNWELTTLYRSIQVSDESVERVIDAVTGQLEESVTTRPRSLLSVRWVPVAAAMAAVVVLALVIAGVRGATHRHAPATDGPPPTVVLPTVQPDTISGAVLRNGQPVSGATVSVQLWPNSDAMAHVQNGQSIVLGSLDDVSSDLHGSFVSRFTASKLNDPEYREGDFINTDIYVTSGGVRASWGVPVQIQAGHSVGVRIVFDLGRGTITIDGKTSKLPMQTVSR